MKYQTKLFELKTKNGSNEINEWLMNNPDITIISAGTFANNTGWGYIILYTSDKSRSGFFNRRT